MKKNHDIAHFSLGFQLRNPNRYAACCVFIIYVFSSCQNENTLFRLLDENETGINFNNTIEENEQYNILNFVNLYTGSGVGIGDFNKDGLSDIFFGGNMVSSQLYLNEGEMKFRDITTLAGVGTDRWVTGVNVADINADGWDDIYLSVSGSGEEEERRNLLFVNQQDGTFLEEARKYGIDDSAQCTHSAFFDYDQDGDLDLFIIVNPTNYNLYNVNTVKRKKVNGEAESTDKLYRNNGQGHFEDVSDEAGILIEGYSLGLNVSDLNADGWSDIYITNDFLTNDVLYINNKNGSFTNRAAEMLDHTSFASMGVDVADLNNDGHPEIFVLDMFPEDNYRQKMIMGGGNYDRFEYILKAGYEPQYSRNTLQLNNGYSNYSEIGQLAGIHKTDWSWSTLMADYDNDGYKDIFVTNGFRRDMGDLDFINYKNTNPFGNPEARKKEFQKRIKGLPGAQLSNYAFRNIDGLNFENVSKEWGLDLPSYSHGAAFADLDLDGDLDMVINNVSMPAFIYENQATEHNENHWIKIDLGNDLSHNIGAKVYIYYGEGKRQFSEIQPCRGYQSTVEQELHFGIGNANQIDRLFIKWQDGRKISKSALKADSTYNFQDAKYDISGASRGIYDRWPKIASETSMKGLKYGHKEDLRVDFNSQPLLPHQHSRSGPCLCKSDLNKDGVEDVYIGGAAGSSGSLFLSNEDGYRKASFQSEVEKEEVDCIFFDLDNDGNEELYVVSGGPVDFGKASAYQDQLFKNVGGELISISDQLPKMNSVGGCVLAHDYNGDGHKDLFVGGRVEANFYPSIPESYLLKNEKGELKNVTPDFMRRIGMVSDGLWSDYDEDGDKDLLLVGEFMPLKVVKNENNQMHEVSSLIDGSEGWWNTIEGGDFDGDGDEDFLIGNLGLNSNHKASRQEPLRLYAKDFDENGSIDPVLCHYIDGKEHTVAMRDKLIGQIPPMKNRFNDYASFAKAGFQQIFRNEERKGMQILEAKTLTSSYVENKGSGIFSMSELPMKVQMAPLQDFEVSDFNDDGFLDALVIGNSYATDVSIGRYDAFSGAILYGDGKGKFTCYLGSENGFMADRDAREMIQIKDRDNNNIIVVGNNSDSIQLFKLLNIPNHNK